MAKIKFIDNDEEHNQILYDLDIITDDDNYPLYVKKEKVHYYHEQDFDIDEEIEAYILENQLYQNFSEIALEDKVIYLKDSQDNIFYITQRDYQSIALNNKMKKTLTQKEHKKLGKRKI